MNTKKIVGIDIGGTKCAVLVGEYDGSTAVIVRKETIKTDPAASAYSVIDQLTDLIDKLTEGDSFATIGISCGGPLDSRRGVIQCPPNLPMWDDIPIVDILRRKYRTEVHLMNDANACALAEWMLGAGRGTQNMVFLTFGTGLGAGLILNGRLYAGTNDNAGEAGHIRLSGHGPVGYGKAGSFEGFCSGGGLAQLGYLMALEQYQMGKCPAFFDPEKLLGGISAKSLAEAAGRGDETAIRVFDICGQQLGKGLAILVDILNPECIVIGSIFARAQNLIWPAAERVLHMEALDRSAGCCKVLPAQLGDAIGDYAALMAAVYQP